MLGPEILIVSIATRRIECFWDSRNYWGIQFRRVVLAKSNWRETYMRKVISLIGLLVMLFTIAGITTAADDKTMTWTGYISDSACGVKNAGTAAGKQCTLQCLKQKNPSLAFIDPKSKRVMKI